MFSALKEQTDKKNSTKIAVGYDLGKAVSQISFSMLESGKEVETLSSVAGTEQYNIPTVLCKRKGVNQWYYGKEALRHGKNGDGVLVDDLVVKAERGEEVVVEEESYDPVALLTLFVKRTMSLLNLQFSIGQIEGFMFTVEDLNPRMVDVLNRVAAGLSLKTEQILFQSHVESFYYYMLHQEAELWRYNVMIFDYTTELQSICLECNKKTTPKVILINKNSYPGVRRVEWSSLPGEREEQIEKLDAEFLRIIQAEMEGSIFSTVYLLGDGFKEDWARESLQYLCKSRRVFRGNNLYSKGACYGAMERIMPSPESGNYVYLGADKLKSNIGMNVLRRGEDSYFAILDAGTNWYEVSSDFEVILEDGDSIEFVITSLAGERVFHKPVVLEGLPERPKNTTRLKIHIEMTSVNQVNVMVEDLGFGELFPSSGKGWTHTIMV